MKLSTNLTRGVQEHCSVCNRHLLLFFSSGNVVRSLLWELLLLATVPYGIGEADQTPCLVDGHLEPDQENKFLE